MLSVYTPSMKQLLLRETHSCKAGSSLWLSEQEGSLLPGGSLSTWLPEPVAYSRVYPSNNNLKEKKINLYSHDLYLDVLKY